MTLVCLPSCLSGQPLLQQRPSLPVLVAEAGTLLASLTCPFKLPEFSLGHYQAQEQSESQSLCGQCNIFSRPQWMAIINEYLAEPGCIRACNTSKESSFGATNK